MDVYMGVKVTWGRKGVKTGLGLRKRLEGLKRKREEKPKEKRTSVGGGKEGVCCWLTVPNERRKSVGDVGGGNWKPSGGWGRRNGGKIKRRDG